MAEVGPSWGEDAGWPEVEPRRPKGRRRSRGTRSAPRSTRASPSLAGARDRRGTTAEAGASARATATRAAAVDGPERVDADEARSDAALGVLARLRELRKRVAEQAGCRRWRCWGARTRGPQLRRGCDVGMTIRAGRTEHLPPCGGSL